MHRRRKELGEGGDAWAWVCRDDRAKVTSFDREAIWVSFDREAFFLSTRPIVPRIGISVVMTRGSVSSTFKTSRAIRRGRALFFDLD